MITDFIFDGMSLSEFGYMIVNDGVEDDNLDVSSMTYTTIKSPKSDISHSVDYQYETNYSRTFEIMKGGCDLVGNDYFLTNDDISEITRWLVRKEYKIFKEINTDDVTDCTYFFTQNTVTKNMYAGNCIGLLITVNANSPYGFTEIERVQWDTSTSTEKNIKLDTDEEGYIYPSMKIVCLNDGDFTINNSYENRDMTIKDLIKGEEIIIVGGDTLQISSSNANRNFSSTFNYKFLRLCNMYGNTNNNLVCKSGECNILFTYRGIRKVGM